MEKSDDTRADLDRALQEAKQAGDFDEVERLLMALRRLEEALIPA